MISNFEVIEKVQDRLSRANKLLVFNIVENLINTNDDPLGIVNDIIKGLSLNSVVYNTRIIGKPGAKPRPILVEFKSSSDIKDTLESKSKLKNDVRWRSVWIEEDLTKTQRDHLFLLRSELRQKKESGDFRWYIRFGKGTPSLAKKNKLIIHRKSINLFSNKSCNNVTLERNVNNFSFFTYYQNVRGFRTKLDLVKRNVYYLNYYVFVLTETWTQADISDSELGMSNYKMFWLDRNSYTSNLARVGGVLISVSNNFKSSRIDLPHNDVEQLYVKVNLNKNNVLIICTCYLAPNSL